MVFISLSCFWSFSVSTVNVMLTTLNSINGTFIYNFNHILVLLFLLDQQGGILRTQIVHPPRPLLGCH